MVGFGGMRSVTPQNCSPGLTEYPFFGGHEVAGNVVAAGDHVSHVKVGNRVGLGAHAGYCMTCPDGLSGSHNTCPSASATVIGRPGGFADVVRAYGFHRPGPPISMLCLGRGLTPVPARSAC
jgi:D-arabinose 1-dehydrogenase-like Zn-dependent alcohol dehydrogenase